MVRTIAGLAPLSVLWRRLDSTFADPLELDRSFAPRHAGPASARCGAATCRMVNALGSGVLETRALLAFLPRICRLCCGEPLAMPNIATWWCGQAAEREHVRANADRMMIGSALSTRLPFDIDETTVLGDQSAAGPAASVDAWPEPTAAGLVGQEAVTLSTTPAMWTASLCPAR